MSASPATVSVLLDGLHPEACPAHSPDGHRPFVFIWLASGGSFDVWAHEPAAFRRLADACHKAADALDDAIVVAKAVPA